MRRSPLSFWITVLVLIFLYVPIIVLIITSFNDSRFGGEWMGFTFKWYERLWNEHKMWYALRNSLIVGVSATVASTILGTCAAFALHRYKTRLQKVHYGLIYTPLLIPDILTGISLLLFFVTVNIQLGLFTVFIAHTTFCMSYVTMVMLSKLQNFDFTLIEAAQDLGANTWTLTRRVLLPLLAPGLMAGALLAFMLSIDDFVITFFVAGQGVSTLPIYVYNMIKFGSTPIVNALSVLILVITFVFIFFTQSLSKDD
ncbi:Spermidine/putrescine transport system permease protein [Candidatus Protochlamydia naegleriophila]|uniref:Spermidine/putrescine transport system permease protein n=1 Tax=Candidatus Protochlamydia naegleriophila TaxID=389348 RepID=A0A0U5CPN0_9BACT|nr:ABC transporter permease [Candidatus Protochlamydia naegleriophila]CUI16684.1 Spermidine/putrescine transport system permease protein [Candidatus Protochlamydia naegleriophila]